MLLGVLLWFLGLVLQRDPQRDPDSSRRAGAPGQPKAPIQSDTELALAESPSSGTGARVSIGDGAPDAPSAPEVASAPAAPATISGRLRLDGTAPEGGRLRLWSEDGTWESSAVIDHEGRFLIGGVPASRLVLSFELQPSAERVLLLPVVEVVPGPGGTEELDLDWETRHVNLRVLGDGPAGNRARVDIEGAGIRASIETDEDGKARLSLVGQGLISFRAELPGGRQGAATLELAEGSGLDSVVITATVPR